MVCQPLLYEPSVVTATQQASEGAGLGLGEAEQSSAPHSHSIPMTVELQF